MINLFLGTMFLKTALKMNHLENSCVLCNKGQSFGIWVIKNQTVPPMKHKQNYLKNTRCFSCLCRRRKCTNWLNFSSALQI